MIVVEGVYGLEQRVNPFFVEGMLLRGIASVGIWLFQFVGKMAPIQPCFGTLGLVHYDLREPGLKRLFVLEGVEQRNACKKAS